MKKILVVLDWLTSNSVLVDSLMFLNENDDIEVNLLTIVKETEPTQPFPDEVHRKAVLNAERVMNDLKMHLEANSIYVASIQVSDASVADAVCVAVNDCKLDMALCIANHADGLAGIFEGTADKIAHEAPCPVIFVKEGYPLSSFQRLLVAVSHDNHCEEVLEKAVAFANNYNSSLCVLNILEPSKSLVSASGIQGDAYQEAAVKEHRETINILLNKLDTHKLNTSTIVIPGDYSEKIVQVSSEINAGVTIMGKSGSSLLSRIFCGGDGRAAMRNADNPVMIV